jgi:hypothetical protein
MINIFVLINYIFMGLLILVLFFSLFAYLPIQSSIPLAQDLSNLSNQLNNVLNIGNNTTNKNITINN